MILRAYGRILCAFSKSVCEKIEFQFLKGVVGGIIKRHLFRAANYAVRVLAIYFVSGDIVRSPAPVNGYKRADKQNRGKKRKPFFTHRKTPNKVFFNTLFGERKIYYFFVYCPLFFVESEIFCGVYRFAVFNDLKVKVRAFLGFLTVTCRHRAYFRALLYALTCEHFIAVG